MMDANETLNQLTQAPNGINRLAATIGAKNFVHDDDSIRFKFPAMKHGARYNFIQITLDANDTYTVKIARLVKHSLTKVTETSGLYCDMLKSHFEKTTGLYVSL